MYFVGDAQIFMKIGHFVQMLLDVTTDFFLILVKWCPLPSSGRELHGCRCLFCSVYTAWNIDPEICHSLVCGAL